MSELKRCPCCGGEATLCNYYFVQCKKCGISTLTFITKEEAIKAWNTRKPMENIAERLEEELHLSYKEKERCVCLYPLQFDEAKGYARGIANAIEIVKEEGE